MGGGFPTAGWAWAYLGAAVACLLIGGVLVLAAVGVDCLMWGCP